MTMPFVPDGFTPPPVPEHAAFRLEPLGPEHNRRDHEAWSSSIAHIRSTPGFPMEDDWPSPKSLEENLADLEEHAADFDAGRGFTYTVLEPVGERVIGCVYLYPDPTAGADVHVRSWVRSSHAHLDAPLWSTVSTWIERDWPFRMVSYAPRGD